ncbi:MAG: hypothetical protein HC822_27445 [Oscillochloris sp.]|nr:hypothetical protein [Oscillochloris sp.]
MAYRVKRWLMRCLAGLNRLSELHPAVLTHTGQPESFAATHAPPPVARATGVQPAQAEPIQAWEPNNSPPLLERSAEV